MKSRIVTALLSSFVLCCASGCSEVVTHEVKQIEPVVNNYQVPKTVYFADDFAPENTALRNAWQYSGKGAWVVQKRMSELQGCDVGCLRQNSEDPRALNVIASVKAPQFSDGTIETHVRLAYDLSVAETPERLKDLKSFIGSGIVFRMVDENNYYMFRLAGEEGAVLGKMVNGQWIDLGNPRRVDFLEAGRIRPNTWYTLKVVAHGGNIQCFIDNNPIVSLNDPSFSVGRFGLSTFKTASDFEYISVTE